MKLTEILCRPDIKRLQSGSELLLAWAVNKYAKFYMQEEVTLEGLSILKRVQYSPHFAFLVGQGYKMGAYDNRVLQKYNPKFFCNDKIIKNIDLIEQENSYIFNWQSNRDMTFHGMNRSAAYVELLAYIIVLNYMNRTNKVLIIDQTGYTEGQGEYNDLLVLKEYGNKIADKTVLDLRSNPYQYKDTECDAFVSWYQQRGYMLGKVPATRKYEYAMRCMFVGQVFLYYKRTDKGIIRSCYPAVIRGISEVGLKFTYYTVVETKLTRYAKLNAIREKHGGESVYGQDDYEAFYAKVVEIPWAEVGVDTTAFDECNLLVPLFRDDGTKQVFRASDEQVMECFVDTVETVYAVFENRKVPYDKAAFLNTYYTDGTEPLYDRFCALGYDQQR